MPTVSQGRDTEASHTRKALGNWSAGTVLVALSIAVLLVAGCGPATRAGSVPTATERPSLVPTPTDIALQGPPLQWIVGSLPPGTQIDTPSFLNVPEVAPNDGNIAYFCANPTSTSVGAGIWVTHDRARHWIRLADLPSVPHQLTRCRIIPDAVDPAIVSAVVSWTPMKELGAPPYLNVDNFVTFDGGHYWQPFSGPQPLAVEWTATYHGTTTAVLATPATYTGLWRSHDQMQTWQRVSPGMNIDMSSLSINPSNGQLVQFGAFTGSAVSLEESDDDGQHWTTIPTPLPSSPPPGANMPGWGASYMISPPAPGQPWRICGPGFVPGRAARDADRRTFQLAVWLPNGYTRATGQTRWEPLLGNDDGAHSTRAGLWNTAPPRLSPGPHRTRATNSSIRSVGRGFV